MTGPARRRSAAGVTRQATEVGADTDLRVLVRERWAQGQHVDYVIVDEAQFLSPEQVDQLAELANDVQIDVYCFGIARIFSAGCSPGARRLFEVADELQPSSGRSAVLVRAPWPRFNARVRGGEVLRQGDTGSRRRHGTP
jgi:thymidine kinase